MSLDPKDMGSSMDFENFDALMKAQANVGKLVDKGQQQYSTPLYFARILSQQLPGVTYIRSALDPQGAAGNNVAVFPTSNIYVMEIDKRFGRVDHKSEHMKEVRRITGNCVTAIHHLQETWPNVRFHVVNANPPFGMSWLMPDGSSKDSTSYTWDKVLELSDPRDGMGYFIAAKSTIEKLGIHTHPKVYMYQTFTHGLWKNVKIDIGVVHWTHRSLPNAERLAFHYGPEFWTLSEEQQRDVMYNNYRSDKRYIEHFHKDFYISPAMVGMDSSKWNTLADIIKEEMDPKQAFNIDLNKQGLLSTYLSTKRKLQLTRQEVQDLNAVHESHPLQLTTERHTRKLLRRLIDDGTYTISQEAKASIVAALHEVNLISAPIRPVTDFGSVAYAEEEDHLTCIPHDVNVVIPAGTDQPKFIPGKNYEFETGSYTFTRRYERLKVKYNEEKDETYADKHTCELEGVDRFLSIKDENNRLFRFMEFPQHSCDLPEILLWSLFDRPKVPTIVDLDPEEYQRNLQHMEIHEMLNGFTYFPGQKDYYARMGMRNYGLVAAETGTGKTVGAITLHVLKSPKRTLIIAPQGTMRNSNGESEDFDNAAQWVQELRKFCPTEPVFQLFCEDDYRSILKANANTLPDGIYISYPTAMYRNKSLEFIPGTWGHERLCSEMNLNPGPWFWVISLKDLASGETLINQKALPSQLPAKFKVGDVVRFNNRSYTVLSFERKFDYDYAENIGMERKGIRCIATPCLATVIEEEERIRSGRDKYCPWDMVLLDEGHLICNLDSQITQTFIRQQPKHRFVLTATPIPNLVTNIFSIMGWICVPHWHVGDKLNAAWPYKPSDLNRFARTFMCQETDLTQQNIDRRQRRTIKGPTPSPIISSPARLLKLISHSLAYISKKQCNPRQVDAEVIDVRVPLGSAQAKLYGLFTNRGNIQFTKAKKKVNPLTRALMQSAILRGICADPKGWSKDDVETSANTPKEYVVRSNFNAKCITILQLIGERLAAGEQVVVVNARVGQTDELARRLESAGITYGRIDSRVVPGQHAEQAALFKTKQVPVLFMGIKCAQAYSFDQCTNLIVGSLEWSYGTLNQALGRVYRLTSPKTVKVWVVLHSNSIEEALYDRVAQKKDAATLCLHGERMPTDFKTFDPEEVLAQHLIDLRDKAKQKNRCEVECENEWPVLLSSLSNAGSFIMSTFAAA